MAQKDVSIPKIGILGKPDSFELWDQIISQPSLMRGIKKAIKDKGKILIIGGGWGTEIKVLVKKFGKKILKHLVFNDLFFNFTNRVEMCYNHVEIIQGDFLNTNMKYKFHAALSNYPFADINKNPLFYKFHNKVFDEILLPGAPGGFVSPNALAVALETGVIKGKHPVKQIDIDLINVSSEIKEKYFPDVGSTFCYYIGKNKPKTDKPYTIVADGGTYKGKFDPLKPKVSDKVSLDILAKCFEFNVNEYNGVWKTLGKLGKKDPNGKDTAVERVDKDGKLVTYPVSSLKENPMKGMTKVFLSSFGTNATLCHNDNWIPGVDKIYTVIVKNKEQGNALVWLIKNSKISKFFRTICETRGPYIDFLRNVKKIPLSKKINDKEIFEYFKLSKQEIKKIEKICK